jgi:hypothetical protein
LKLEEDIVGEGLREGNRGDQELIELWRFWYTIEWIIELIGAWVIIWRIWRRSLWQKFEWKVIVGHTPHYLERWSLWCESSTHQKEMKDGNLRANKKWLQFCGKVWFRNWQKFSVVDCSSQFSWISTTVYKLIEIVNLLRLDVISGGRWFQISLSQSNCWNVDSRYSVSVQVVWEFPKGECSQKNDR